MAVRYRHILEALRARLAGGAYPVGGHFPTEEDLCAEFDASRHTVREAMRRLVEQGMVSRRPKHGTVVTAATPRHHFVQSLGSIAELFQFALTTHFEVRDTAMVAVPSEVAEEIGAEPDSLWLRVDGVRRTKAGGELICLTVSFIPERLAWIEPELRGCVGPFYALIESRAGEAIVDAMQEIKAEAMPDGGAPSGIALRLLRRYSSAKGTLIASYNWHPGESFTYRMQLRRAGDA